LPVLFKRKKISDMNLVIVLAWRLIEFCQSHLLWFSISYGGRFFRRRRRLDGSSTDMPPPNSIPPPRIPDEMVTPLAAIVSTYYRKRRKLSHRIKILQTHCRKIRSFSIGSSPASAARYGSKDNWFGPSEGKVFFFM
jgi:hypothetical protein